MKLSEDTIQILIPCMTAIIVALLLFATIFSLSSCQYKCTKVNAENGLLTYGAGGGGYAPHAKEASK